MLLDCHTHTRVHSACASLEPDTLCKLALDRGVDALVLTEHHHQWTQETLRELETNHPPLRLYAGVELTLAEGYDVILIAPPPLLHAYGAISMFQPLRRLQKRLALVREEVFAFVAHPFRYACDTPEALSRIFAWVDGMEVNSVNILRGGHVPQDGLYAPANWQCYADALASTGCLAMYNTDCHHPQGVGALANDIPGGPPADEAALVRCLRSAAITQWQHRNVLTSLLRQSFAI